LNRTD